MASRSRRLCDWRGRPSAARDMVAATRFLFATHPRREPSVDPRQCELRKCCTVTGSAARSARSRSRGTYPSPDSSRVAPKGRPSWNFPRGATRHFACAEWLTPTHGRAIATVASTAILKRELIRRRGEWRRNSGGDQRSSASRGPPIRPVAARFSAISRFEASDRATGQQLVHGDAQIIRRDLPPWTARRRPAGRPRDGGAARWYTAV